MKRLIITVEGLDGEDVGRWLPNKAEYNVDSLVNYVDAGGRRCTGRYEACPHGDNALCEECSLVNYGRDCDNNKLVEGADGHMIAW